MATIVYLNGKFLPLEEAKISAADYGFLFGYAIFETMRVYDGTIFRLKNHIDRLMKSLNILEIPLNPDMLERTVMDTVRVNGLGNARVRLTVSAGSGNPVIDLNTCEASTVLVISLPYIPILPEVYERGFRLSIAGIRRNSRSVVQSIKKTDYLESILARRAARDAGADDALLLNDNGFVAEGSTNNIFMVERGVLRTPSLTNGILPGITRDVVLELASRSGMEVLETDILPDEIMAAEEVFLTSSMMEVMPVTQISDKVIGNGKPGQVTKKLIRAYKEEVQREIRNSK